MIYLIKKSLFLFKFIDQMMYVYSVEVEISDQNYLKHTKKPDDLKVKIQLSQVVSSLARCIDRRSLSL